jgi:hypothetical protein
MKLYELNRGDVFTLVEDAQAPPGEFTYSKGTKIKLHNIDGMYSYCTVVDTGKRCHPIAWAEVEKHET